MKSLPLYKKYSIYQLFPLIIFLGLWELFSYILGDNIFPGFETIVPLLWNSFSFNAIIAAQDSQYKGFNYHVVETFFYGLSGFFTGFILGIFISVVIFLNKTFKKIFSPLLEVFRTIPPLILAPFLLIIFPTNPISKFIMVSAYSAYSTIIYSVNALNNINKNYIELAKIYCNSTADKIVNIFLPAIIPEITGGIRISIAISIGVLIVAEYMGPNKGIGKVLQYAIQYSRVDLILVGITWSILVVIVIDYIFLLLTKRWRKWI